MYSSRNFQEGKIQSKSAVKMKAAKISEVQMLKFLFHLKHRKVLSAKVKRMMKALVKSPNTVRAQKAVERSFEGGDGDRNETCPKRVNVCAEPSLTIKTVLASQSIPQVQ